MAISTGPIRPRDDLPPIVSTFQMILMLLNLMVSLFCGLLGEYFEARRREKEGERHQRDQSGYQPIPMMVARPMDSTDFEESRVEEVYEPIDNYHREQDAYSSSEDDL